MSKLLILAGGLGTRLRSVVSDVPKPMAPIMGVPFLEHVLNFYRSDFSEVVISVGYQKEVIKKYFGNEFNGINITYVEEDMPLGTGGAFRKMVLETCHDVGSFLLINGDTFVDYNFKNLRDFHEAVNSDVTILTCEAEAPERFDKVYIGADRRIYKIASDKCKPGEFASAGVYFFSNSTVFFDMIAGMPHNFSMERDFLSKYVSEAHVYGYQANGFFVDIGVPFDYKRAQTVLGGEV